MSGNEIGDEGATAIANVLLLNTSLIALDLSCTMSALAIVTCHITALKMVEPLLSPMHFNSTHHSPLSISAVHDYISHVDASGNENGYEGFAAIANALQLSSALTTL